MVAVAATVASLAARAQAGKFNEVLDIGDAAPDFAALPGADDAEHGLADYADAAAVVVLFTCNHCPVAAAYEPRLIALQAEYAERGVRIVAVSVSRRDGDKLPDMKERAMSAGYNFPYLYDASQDTARAYGALATPQVFLLDAERRVVYMGRIDDSTDAGKVRRHYLRDALEATLAGRPVEFPETRAVGCAIELER